MKSPRLRRVLITVSPFGETDRDPLELLERNHIRYELNAKRRRLTSAELAERIPSYEVLLAGTEPITESVLDAAPDLRLIARSGIGLDSVPLAAARARGIAVTWTPDAPTAAVAELTIGQMIALLRHIPAADRDMHRGAWQRRIGRSLGESVIGVIGVGRVGRSVIRHLQSWKPKAILVNDLRPDPKLSSDTGCVWTSVDTLYREADIVTLHLPLTPATRGMIRRRELEAMKPGAILINTSRGGIVEEADLVEILRAKPQFSAAVDVFVEEPYSGPLSGLENCLLTCHMGSGTRDSRLRMEMEAAREVVRYFEGRPPANPVPEEEYALQV